MGVFSTNPLSLNLPDAAFESWLRDKGYLEILGERTCTLASSLRIPDHHGSSSTTSAITRTITGPIPTASFFSFISTLVSLLTLNPFAKLTADDFGGETPSWTFSFLGSSLSCYSWPSGPAQARMRVHENVKRYARNYAVLGLIFFACSLYQMPIVLFGLILSLALWELFRFYGSRWGVDNYPVVSQTLVRLLQCATGVILYYCNLQLAFFCATAVSYGVMVLHASLRKLMPKQPVRSDGKKRFQRSR